MIEALSVLFGAVFSYILVRWLGPHLLKAGIYGIDQNDPNERKVPEMGGFAIVGAIILCVMGVLFMNTLGVWMPVKGMNGEILMAGLLTIVIAAFVGAIDDLISLKQWQKALLPVVAAVPLIAIQAGVSFMWLPYFGVVELGIIYYLIIIPVIVTGATNATNMLAGFNGIEAGLGGVSLLSLGVVSFHEGNYEAAIIALSMVGALMGFLIMNRYPARIYPGDIGTLPIGAAIAVVVIVGNLYRIGLFVMLIYMLEFILKARGKFKTQSWCRCEDGVLTCDTDYSVHGVGRLIMRITGGVTEINLVLIILFIHTVITNIGMAIFYLYP